MPQFIDVHTGMQGITNEQLQKEHRKDLDNELDENVHFVKSWADAKSGTVFCLSEGPDKEAVLRVHAKAGHPTTEIYEIDLIAE